MQDAGGLELPENDEGFVYDAVSMLIQTPLFNPLNGLVIGCLSKL